MIAAVLAVLFFAAAPAAEPSPASHPRPRALWSGAGQGISRVHDAPIDAQGRLFLFDARTRVPFAVRAATGERLWTATPDPSSPPVNPYVADHPTITLSGETVVVVRLDYVAAHRAADGKLLWSRSDRWGNYDVRGEHILFKGAGTRELTLIHAATGAVVFSPQNPWPERPQDKDADVVLGTRTLLVSSQNATRMKGYLPRPGGPLPRPTSSSMWAAASMRPIPSSL